MALEIKTKSQHFIIGVEYAFFWWGLFALYCIGYQINRIRIYRIRQKRILEKQDAIQVTGLPGSKLFYRLDYCVGIPFITKMIPIKYIIGIFLFTMINVLFIFFAPFVFNQGGYIPTTVTITSFDRRSIFIGIINLGFVFFLAQRNSILVKMSGLTFEQLIPFHRIISRISLLEFLPHFIWRLISGWNKNHVVKDMFFRTKLQTTGSIAMFAVLLMYFTSSEYIRRHYFEVFYYCHVFFLLIAVIFSCLHETICFVVFIPAVILWAADRIIRTWNSWFTKSTLICVDEVVAPTASQDGISRILVENNRLFKVFKPGQYVFTSIIVNGKKMWEYANWHPFTISEIFRFNPKMEEEHDIGELVQEKKDPSPPDSILGTDSTISSNEVIQLRRRACHQDQNTSFIASIHVKARGKKTRDVLKSAAAHDLIKVYMDGPYGPQLQYQDYPIVALFATGIGITPALSIIKDIIDKRSKGILTVCTNHIYLVWVIRHSDETLPFIDMFNYWIDKCKHAIQPIQLSVSIFVTRMKQGPFQLSEFPGFKISFGQRPQIDIEMDKIKTVNAKHRVWAHACGSSIFTRTVINEAIKHNFDCHNETFEL